jgi:predicted dithiol-disulfide oxidoreductase (DUF899 family)
MQHLRFPNESTAYREARNALLAEEMELRRQVERVAAHRRALPMGGELREDYAFEGESGAHDAVAALRAGQGNVGDLQLNVRA